MVTTTTAPAELVATREKRDRLGRKITPTAQREELVGAWQQSWLTQAAFARWEGVRYPTFASSRLSCLALITSVLKWTDSI